MLLAPVCMQAQLLPARVMNGLPPENYMTVRDGLNNFYRTVRFSNKATVAFLGGSITCNPGWRDKVCAYLKEQFPQTTFHFIKAGVPSLGSLPHSFRLQQDVLDSGKIDLLFIEAAVNDRANETDSTTQVRALDGIVRHTRQANPLTDILLMSFADPAKTTDYNNNITPAEIANHELIAARYHLPSVNLAKEVRDKINNHEFSWKKDFKDLHPSPFGQELYFQAIEKLLNLCYTNAGKAGFKSTKRMLPLLPPDIAAIDNGEYVSVDKAMHDNKWQLVDNWTPSDSLSTREGFVHVPVVMAAEAGAELSFTFKGRAVGIAIVSGADAGIIETSIGDGPYSKTDLFTQWSSFLHLPWYLLLANNLADKEHVLHIKTSNEKNTASKGHACRIVHFLVNK